MKYSLGLDIGVTSVGWAVINEEKKRIEDLGVRIFEKAEHPKDGASLATPRREARGLRRRLARRSKRVNSLKDIFIENNLLTEKVIQTIYLLKNSKDMNPYFIRVKALDSRITEEELYIALHHIFKRRGYKSARKKVEENDKETGLVLGSLKQNNTLLSKYRSVGEMFFNDEKFSKKIGGNKVFYFRNQGGDYSHTVLRSDFEKEIVLILKKQREFGFSLSLDFEKKTLEDFNFQKGFATGDQLKKMVGYCTFEKSELRAAKHTHSFQLFSLLQRLTQIRIQNRNIDERRLSKEDIKIAINFAYVHKDMTYKQLRKELSLSDEDTFNLVNYFQRKKRDDSEDGKSEDPEQKAKVGSLTTYYELTHNTKKVFVDGVISETKENVISQKTWDNLFENNHDNIDAFATVNTLYKTDEDVITHLKIEIPNISDQEIQELLTFDYTKFGNLSLTAIRKINKFLFEGYDYDKACEKAGYEFKGRKQEKTKKLSSFFIDHLREGISKREIDTISNPVVKRAISQTVKVINVIIEKHGSPYYIKIECARDLGKNFKERAITKKNQEEGRENNEKIKEEIEEFGVSGAVGPNIVKFKLWKQQGCKCAYSQKFISEEELFGENFVEVDHIIPYSRSGDDGNNNKVLVLKASNQDKINRTPYEWFGNEEEKWSSFEAYIKSLRLPYKKEQNLLIKKYKNDDWNIRALNDTRYITKYIKNHVENTLLFEEGEDKQRVIVTNGQTTAYLRKRWGLSKDRDESNLHHAMDASIIATVCPLLIQKITHHSKYGEVRKYLQAHKTITATDPSTGEKYTEEEIEQASLYVYANERDFNKKFPQPWSGFTEEVRMRLNAKITTDDELRRYFKDKPAYQYDDLSFLKVVFVSRMPRRGVTGQMHKETFRSPKFFEQGENRSSIKKLLTQLKLKDLENIAGETKQSVLYKEIKQRLEAHNDKADIAFREPIYRRDKDGNPVNIVRSVKIIDNAQNSGFIINEGKTLVDNGGMARVDIFSKEIKGKKKYFTVPVYNHEIGKRELPTKIYPNSTELSVDDTFTFCFSLYQNDYFKVYYKTNETKEGYYVGYDISTGQYTVINHLDSDKTKAVRLPIKTAESVEKYQVDVLGNYTKVQHENRVGKIIKKK